MARVPRNFENGASSTKIFFGTITRLKPFMTPDEFLVVMFIYDRTVRYGKPVENIPLRHFMKGVRDGEGRYVTPRVGLSKANLLRAIHHLFHKGIIFTDHTPYGGSNTYQILPIEEINICEVREYVSSAQRPELGRGLLTDQPTNDTVTQLSAEEYRRMYRRASNYVVQRDEA